MRKSSALVSSKNTHLKIKRYGKFTLFSSSSISDIMGNWVLFQGFGPNVGGLIHVLLVIAVIAIILKIINRAA